MKKLFSFVCALVCAMSLSADDYYIAGDSETLFGGFWNTKGLKLTANEGGTYSHTFTTCEIGTSYQFKVTDGTWNNSWGYDALESKPEGVTNSGGNIKCTTYDATMTVVFNPTTKKITLTGVFVNSGDPIPTTYYMKHDWYDDGWKWLPLVSNGDGTYSIRQRYGATGCNWNTSASDDGSNWVGSPTLVDNPTEGDSAVFTLNPTAEKPITITKIKGAEVVINYVEITIRVMADAAPTIWWWGAGSKCPDAEKTTNAEGVTYTWDNQPVMTAVDGKTGWYEWVLKDVNADKGVSFRINSGNTIVAKESTCYDVNGTVIEDCGSTGGEGGGTDPSVTEYWYFDEKNTGWNGTIGDKWKMTVSDDIAYVKVPARQEANKFKIFPCNPKVDDKVLANADNIAEGALAGDIPLSKDTEDWKNILIGETSSEYFVVLYLPNTATNSSSKYLVAAKTQLSSGSTPTALTNTEVENAVVKVIRNGQVLIVREGVTYNMMGQVIQ